MSMIIVYLLHVCISPVLFTMRFTVGIFGYWMVFKDRYWETHIAVIIYLNLPIKKFRDG